MSPPGRLRVVLTPGQQRALLRDGPQVWTVPGGVVTIDAQGWCEWTATPPWPSQQALDDLAREILDLDVEEGG